MKRICIYVTYDRQGVVDAYVGYVLSEIRKNTDKLFVVCNELNIERGLEYISLYADKIFFRENIGYDAGAFKDALCEFVGWGEIKEYDELLLINDSFFGPFVPLETILNEMGKKNVDFWGLITHAEIKKGKVRHIPSHVQSYFLAIRDKMLQSKSFIDYWEKMPYYQAFEEVIKNHEIKFTEYFSQKGFTYAGLADSSINDSAELKNNYNQYVNLSYELIKKRKFPVLKKQQLAHNTLYQQTQENYLRAIQYIEKNTDYDVNLIWDNIIRTLDVNDLQRNLHLLYIIDDLRKNEYNNVYENDTVIIVNTLHKTAYENVLEYLQPIQNNARLRIIINPGSQEIAKFYLAESFEVLNIGTKFSEILKIIFEYEYICILNDEDLSSDDRPSYIGKSYFFNIWGNLIGENAHIENVLELLVREERIGVLMPPESNFGVYFGRKTDWNNRYRIVRKVIEEHGIECICSKDKCPFSVSKSLWIKKDVLKRLPELAADEMEILEYLWIYLAQEQGLLSGIVESAEYASMNEINMNFYLNDLTRQVLSQYGEVEIYPDLKKHLFLGAVSRFCLKYKYIYIYGIGYMARYYLPYIPRVDAYIVSDGQYNPGEFEKKKVYYLSDVPENEDIGVIVCLDKEHQAEVLPILQRRNVKNYICI